MQSPRIVAGLLALAGAYWAIHLLSYFSSPGAGLVVLPGFLIWTAWIWRAFSRASTPLFVATWLFSMVWHLAVALLAPLLAALMNSPLIIREYAVGAMVLSLIGLLLEFRTRKPSANTETNEANKPEQDDPLQRPSRRPI
jgi:hypothetical protein